MKSLLLSLAACAALAGCVGYGGGYVGTGYPGYYGGVYSSPSYHYGGGVYAPIHRGYRDRDGDGIPNRYDRDRDGDGVRNRDDARPNNPRRY